MPGLIENKTYTDEEFLSLISPPAPKSNSYSDEEFLAMLSSQGSQPQGDDPFDDVITPEEFRSHVPPELEGNVIYRTLTGWKDNTADAIGGVGRMLGLPGLSTGYDEVEHNQQRNLRNAYLAVQDEEGLLGKRATGMIRQGGESLLTGFTTGGVGAGVGRAIGSKLGPRAAAAAGSQAALIAQYSADTLVTAHADAVEAGLSPGQADAHAFTMALIEGGGTYLGGKYLGGVYEKTFGGERLESLSKAIFGEIGEEWGIYVAQTLAEAYNGVAELPTFGEAASEMFDIAGATLVGVGAAAGSQKAGDFLENRSRSNAKKLNIPPEAAKSRVEREKLSKGAREAMIAAAKSNPEMAQANAQKIAEFIVQPTTAVEEMGVRDGVAFAVKADPTTFVSFDTSMSDEAFLDLTKKKKASPRYKKAFVEAVDAYRDLFKTPDVFTPTAEWQTIPEGTAIPPGLEIRMNMETGVNEARIPPGQGNGPSPIKTSHTEEAIRLQGLVNEAMPESGGVIVDNEDGTFTLELESGKATLEPVDSFSMDDKTVDFNLKNRNIEVNDKNREAYRQGLRGTYRIAGHDGLGLIRLRKEMKENPSDVLRHELVHLAVQTGLVSEQELRAWARERAPEAKTIKQMEEAFAMASENWVQRGDSFWQRARDWINELLAIMGFDSNRIQALEESVFSGGRLAPQKPAAAPYGVPGNLDPAMAASTMGASEEATGRPNYNIPGITDRFRGLANQTADLIARQANYDVDEEMGDYDRKKWIDAWPEAQRRINADPQGEIDRVMAKIDAAEASNGTVKFKDMADLVVHSLLSESAAREGYSENGTAEGRAMHRRLHKAFRESRTADAQRLTFRDPLAGTAKARMQKAIYDTLSTMDEDSYQKVKEALAADGIDINNVDMLMDNPRIAAEVLERVRPRTAYGEMETGEKIQFWNDVLFEYWRNAILSGPMTQAKNIAGNTLFSAYHFLGERPVEAVVNLFAKDPKGTQLGELGPMFAAIVPGIKRGLKNAITSWKTERSALSDELGRDSAFKIEGNRHAIPGKTGRLVRAIGYRQLLAVDEFAKSITATMEAAAQAYRIANMEGHRKGQGMNARMAKLVNDLGSPAWDAAILKAEELAFQGTHGALAEKIAKGINLFRKVPMGKYVVPFRDTPASIFEEGLKRVPGFGIMLEYADLRRQGKTIAESGMTPMIARQIMGAAAVLLMWDMVDDDDPWITGTESLKDQSDRNLSYRSIPAQSIKIPGFDAYQSYAGIEPFATTISAIVDFIHGFKKSDTGSVPDAALKGTESGVLGIMQQTKSKTFLDGVSDFIETVDRLFEGDLRQAYEWSSKFSASWVPNIYRQTATAAEQTMPEGRVWGKEGEILGRILKRTAQKAQIPEPVLNYFGVQTTQRFDPWGRKIQFSDSVGDPRTDFAFRLLVPSKRQDLKKVQKMDMALFRYNAKQAEEDDKVYFIEPEKFFRTKVKGKDRTTYFTDEQYAVYAQLAGERSLRYALPIKIDPNNPTTRQVELIRSRMTKARAQVRRMLMPYWRRGESGAELLEKYSQAALDSK